MTDIYIRTYVECFLGVYLLESGPTDIKGAALEAPTRHKLSQVQALLLGSLNRQTYSPKFPT